MDVMDHGLHGLHRDGNMDRSQSKPVAKKLCAELRQHQSKRRGVVFLDALDLLHLCTAWVHLSNVMK